MRDVAVLADGDDRAVGADVADGDDRTVGTDGDDDDDDV